MTGGKEKKPASDVAVLADDVFAMGTSMCGLADAALGGELAGFGAFELRVLLHASQILVRDAAQAVCSLAGAVLLAEAKERESGAR